MEKSWLKRTIAYSVVVAVGISGVLVGFSMLVYVWQSSTGFHNEIQDSFKSQEGYTRAPTGAIANSDTGYYAGYYKTDAAVIEPDVSTRDKARLVKNPVPPDPQSIESGKVLFTNYCARCHGAEGDGFGLMGSVPSLRLLPEQENIDLNVYLSGYLATDAGADLNFVQKESEGEIFYTITNGGEAIMPNYADALSPRDRWDVINYIKQVLGRPEGT